MIKESSDYTCVNESFSKKTMKNFDTNKTVVKHEDFTRSAELLVLLDYVLQKKKTLIFLSSDWQL